MATQAGLFKLQGEFHGYVFYEAFGKLIVRKKGTIDHAKQKRNPDIYGLKLRCENNFQRALRMVKPLYYTLPKERREHGLFGNMIGFVTHLLHKGGGDDEVVEKLKGKFGIVV